MGSHGGSHPCGSGGVGGSQSSPLTSVGQHRPSTTDQPCGQHPIEVFIKPIGQSPGGNVVDGLSVVDGVEVVELGVCVVVLVGSTVGTVVVVVVLVLVVDVVVEVEVVVVVVVLVVLVVVVGGSVHANSSNTSSGQHDTAPVDGSINT